VIVLLCVQLGLSEEKRSWRLNHRNAGKQRPVRFGLTTPPFIPIRMYPLRPVQTEPANRSGRMAATSGLNRRNPGKLRPLRFRLTAPAPTLML